MGEGVALRGILLIISLYEVWLYYQLIFGVLIEKKNINKRYMAVLWFSIGVCQVKCVNFFIFLVADVFVGHLFGTISQMGVLPACHYQTQKYV